MNVDGRLPGFTRSPLVIATLLVVTTLAVYLPVVFLGFTHFDDPEYVFENPHVNFGLTGQGLIWAFRSIEASNWHPLTWISHMLDCQFFGLNASAHHVTNVLFHCANTALLFFFLRKLTGATWTSVTVAALFAIHPAHVESVAWISQRKDVLSTFFGLLSLMHYVDYSTVNEQSANRGELSAYGGRKHYIYAFSFFGLALMCKPMLITIPALMLLLDWWPLERFAPRPLSQGWSKFSRLLVEKSPFVALSGFSCVVTILAQTTGGAVASADALPVNLRISNAFVSYVRYLGTLFWPSDLAALYPYQTWTPSVVILSVSAVALATVVAVLYRKNAPYLLFGWCWFLITLTPVIGIVQVGTQSMADRYTYIPAIGLFLAVCCGVRGIIARFGSLRFVTAGVAAAALLALALATQRQIPYWQNSETLFRHALAVTQNNAHAFNELGRYMAACKQWDKAALYYRASVALNPRFASAWNNLGCSCLEQGKVEDAITNCQTALRLNPSLAQAYNNLGTALYSSERPQEAVTQYLNALRLRPEYEEAHYNLGNALIKTGRIPEALQEYSIALKLNPRSAKTYNNCGFALLALGNFFDAAQKFNAALQLDAELWQAQFGLGKALAGLGQHSAAAGQFSNLLQKHPNDPAPRRELESCLTALHAAKSRPGDAGGRY